MQDIETKRHKKSAKSITPMADFIISKHSKSAVNSFNFYSSFNFKIKTSPLFHR